MPKGNNKLYLFLDSGAFSAWNSGHPLDLDAYIKFIKDNIDYIDDYVALDHIPGVPGKVATQEQVNQSAEISFSNYKKMRKAGLTPIPVFHRGEAFTYLQKYLDAGADYVGLGGVAQTNSNLARQWLDAVFTKLTDKAGRPTVKTHGFAATRVDIILRYPWESVDSTSWIRAAGFGVAWVPKFIGGKASFGQGAFPLRMSVEMKDTRNSLASMTPSVQKMYREYFENVVGVTLPDLCNDWQARAKANIYYMKQVEKIAQKVVFKHRTREFFS